MYFTLAKLELVKPFLTNPKPTPCYELEGKTLDNGGVSLTRNYAILHYIKL